MNKNSTISHIIIVQENTQFLAKKATKLLHSTLKNFPIKTSKANRFFKVRNHKILIPSTPYLGTVADDATAARRESSS